VKHSTSDHLLSIADGLKKLTAFAGARKRKPKAFPGWRWKACRPRP
jgi:hypothetical protein